MVNSRVFVAVGIGVLALAVLFLAQGLRDGEGIEQTPVLSEDEVKRDFMFQVTGFKTDNQGGQRLNMYFHYRYDEGITEGQIPNYEDLRGDAISFMDGVDASENPYWETLNKELCTQLLSDYPIQAISCQLQVYPDDRPGLPYEPGYHGSIHTIGDIEPLALPGSIGNERSSWRP